MNKEVAKPRARDEYEIKDDLRAVKRAIKIFKDKDRLKDVQEMIKAEKQTEDVLDAVADGDLQTALGMVG